MSGAVFRLGVALTKQGGGNTPPGGRHAPQGAWMASPTSSSSQASGATSDVGPRVRPRHRSEIRPGAEARSLLEASPPTIDWRRGSAPHAPPGPAPGRPLHPATCPQPKPAPRTAPHHGPAGRSAAHRASPPPAPPPTSPPAHPLLSACPPMHSPRHRPGQPASQRPGSPQVRSHSPRHARKRERAGQGASAQRLSAVLPLGFGRRGDPFGSGTGRGWDPIWGVD